MNLELEWYKCILRFRLNLAYHLISLSVWIEKSIVTIQTKQNINVSVELKLDRYPIIYAQYCINYICTNTVEKIEFKQKFIVNSLIYILTYYII